MVLAALAAVYLYRGHVSRERVLSMENFTEARVDYVIDGDTMIVTADGVTERVRLLGIDCEESVLEDESLNTEKGRQEAAFVKKLVAEGDTVYLQKDVTDRDRYERLLRYMWLALPDDPEDIGEVRTKMLEGILIDRMQTRVEDIPPDVAYSDIFWEISSRAGQDVVTLNTSSSSSTVS